MTAIIIISILFILLTKITNIISYEIMKDKILYRQTWDLNICCGRTDGGGINVDIVQHQELPRFVQIDNIYSLPFADKAFPTVLCSHTLEHVDDPIRFFRELQRIGQKVVLVLPPIWDITAAFNFLEHKWLFLTWKKEHEVLPRFVKLPMAGSIHRVVGQRIKA
ncbi:MAG: methyltransferase domain-containing protein [Candidatus Cloacimonetes bacterium]|nr:methyltransferase domain-containing protein [Candidatus Cloacimonadota bacterium]